MIHFGAGCLDLVNGDAFKLAPASFSHEDILLLSPHSFRQRNPEAEEEFPSAWVKKSLSLYQSPGNLGNNLKGLIKVLVDK